MRHNVQHQNLERLQNIAKHFPTLVFAGATALTIYTMVNDFYLDRIDLQDGAPRRALPYLQPLIVFDPATNSFTINSAKVTSLLEDPRYIPDILDHHLQGIEMFANGDDAGFLYFYHGINEYTDGHHFLIYELFALSPERFSRFIELSRAEQERVPSEYFEPGTFERLESRYGVERAGEVLAIYGLSYDLARFDNNEYLGMILNEHGTIATDLDSFSISSSEDPSEQSIYLQLGLIKNYINLAQIRADIIYTGSSAEERSNLFTWGRRSQQEYLGQVFGTALRPAMLDLALDELDRIAQERFGVSSVLELPIFSTLQEQINKQNAANYNYWEGLLMEIGIETERAGELLDVKLGADDRWDTGGSANNNNLLVDDVDPFSEGVQTARRLLAHELSHLLEPDIESLREFTREMTLCANGDYEQEYPEFTAWCREVLYAGIDLDKASSYVGLATLFTEVEWNGFLDGDTDELLTQYFTVTIDAPSELFAVTMDTIWAHFDDTEIPPRIRTMVSEIFDISQLNFGGDKSRGLKVPILYILMFVFTKLFLWAARKFNQSALRRARQSELDADTKIPVN